LPFTPPEAKKARIIAMKSNLNVDIKFYADKVLGMLGNGLSKYTDKTAGSKSRSTGGRGQGRGGGRGGYGSGAQRRGGRRGRR
jgi:hypothetical protein